MAKSYRDFELHLVSSGEQTYQVSVVRSPAGETLEPRTIDFPFSSRDLERLRLRLENALLRSRTRSRRTLTPEEKTVREFGRKLFDSVFTGDVRSLYYESLREAEREGLGLRIKLYLQPPKFATLPWEFLHEPRADEYVCLSRGSPLVRYLELPRTKSPLTVAPPLRILGMVVSPKDLFPLDVELEKQQVEQAIAFLRDKGMVELHWLQGETALDLQRALRRSRREPWHIFHFIGHGDFDPQRDEGVIWLADKRGRSRQLTATQLGMLLGDHRSLRLAVLNACEGARGSDLDVFSSTAATLIRRGVPAVLAMQYDISDNAAQIFAEMFYESLADGLPVDAAVTEARKAISLDNASTLEWGTPVLYMRAKDGRIFDIDVEAAPAQPQPRERPTPEQVVPAHSVRRAPSTTAQVATETHVDKPAQPVHVLSAPRTDITIPHIVKGGSPLKIEWCWVPGGSFTMGSNEYDDEKPIHEVVVEGFWMARYPVTNAQYRPFVEAGGYGESRWWPEAGWKWASEKDISQPRYWTDKKWNGEEQPVVGVSWYEAFAFCQWAADVTGEQIRLPAEAEWEKAARGNDKRKYPWGNNDPTEKLCNFSGKVGKTTPVGQYSPGSDSPYGCADMAGNVWEWSDSWYQAYPGNETPDDSFGKIYRVVRGGSWYNNADNVRSSNRGRSAPVNRNDFVGFRCASTPF